MADKYFGGSLPENQAAGPEDDALLEKAKGLRARYEADMEAYAFQNALADVFDVIDAANKYIDATAPWVLAKNEETKPVWPVCSTTWPRRCASARCCCSRSCPTPA